MTTEPLDVPEAGATISSSDLSDWVRLVAAATDAVSDTAVERAAQLATEWAAVLGDPDLLRLATAIRPLLRPLADFAEGLQPLAAAGVLQRVLDGLTLMAALLDALTPEQVERLSVFAESFLSLAAIALREDTNRSAREGLTRMQSAWAAAGTGARGNGLQEMWRLLQDPMVRRAILAVRHFVQANSVGATTPMTGSRGAPLTRTGSEAQGGSSRAAR